MERFVLDHLAASTLDTEAVAFASQERTTTAELIARLAVIDAQRLYAEFGYPSMRAYCTGRLRMSEGHAARRIHAARAARDFPILFEALADERLDLTAVNLLAPHLTEKNVEELVAAAAHQSRGRIELMLAERFPHPDVPDGIVGGHGQALPHVRDASRMTPLSRDHYFMQCTLGDSTQAKLREARDLMSHRNPAGAYEMVLAEALDLLIPALKKEKFASSGVKGSPRYLSSEVKKAVWERDGGACSFVSKDGRRCGCRWMVEFDHVDAVACGGEASVGNVRLLCRTHNQSEAERRFGAGFMEEKRREARARRAAHRNRLVGTYAGVCSAPSTAAPAEPETTYASGVAEPRATYASVRSPRFQVAEPTPTYASVRSRQTGKVAAA